MEIGPLNTRFSRSSPLKEVCLKVPILGSPLERHHSPIYLSKENALSQRIRPIFTANSTEA